MGQQTDEGAAQNWHDCAAARAIDLVHLARQTLGDRSLETEILALFVRQSEGLCARIAGAAGEQARRDLAHTLKGSARAVGAWRVAAAAEEIEAAGGPREQEALRASIAEAVASIRALGIAA